MPLVSRNQAQADIQINVSDAAPEAASDRIAARDQPYLANVPLLQESYLFGMSDWYSLVTTLLNSHWDTISCSYSKGPHKLEADQEPGMSEQGESPNWMSWTWLQSFFPGLHAQHRQVG